MATIFHVSGGRPHVIGSAPSMAEASALLPQGTYTTLRTYGGGRRILRLGLHLERLKETAARESGPELPPAAVRAGIAEAMRTVAAGEARIRLTYAPGGLFVCVEPLAPLPDALHREGVACVSVPLRRADPGVKDTRFIATATDTYHRLAAGVHEGLMVADDGALLEGLTSNFFAVREGILHTEDRRVLPGITRGVVLELARGLLPLATETVRLDQVAELSEAFLTSASRGVLPVVRIDSTTVGEGRPGPVTRELAHRFEALVEREAEPLSP